MTAAHTVNATRLREVQAYRDELAVFARLFTIICVCAAFLFLGVVLTFGRSLQGEHPGVQIAGGITALAAALAAIVWHYSARAPELALRLGAPIVIGMAVTWIILTCGHNQPTAVAAGIIGMVLTTLLYPHVFGLLISTVPQLCTVVYLAQNNAWADPWKLAMLCSVMGALVALILFLGRREYFRNNQLLIERQSRAHDALQEETRARAQLQERLLNQQNVNTLGRLARGIAHDFNNALVPILGNAALLDDTMASARQKQQIREIIRAAGRARQLTSQLGAFTGSAPQPESHKAPPLELNTYLAELVPFLWRAFPQGVDVDWQPTSTSVYVALAQFDAQHVFSTILLNAAEAAELGTVVEIALFDGAHHEGVNERECLLEITSTAPISSAAGALVTNPSSADLNQGYTHRRAGLHAAQELAREVGGELLLEYTARGGVNFRLLLPTVAGLPAAAENTLFNPARSNGHILVVDDEHAVRRVTSQLLRRAGYRVSESVSGEDALITTAENTPDLVLMDLRMPGMGGFAAIQALREQQPDLPIVVVTGYDTNVADWFPSAGAHNLLLKPFTPAELLGKVEGALTQAAIH